MFKNNFFLFMVFLLLFFVPVSHSQKIPALPKNEKYAGISLDFLKPESIFDTLKENFRVPEFKDGTITFPEKNGGEKDIPLDVGKYNKDVEEETGVNLLKFFTWIFTLLGRVFSSLADFFGKAEGL
ncbi:MAG: hypothetical protein HYZ69_01880 [Candidatus Colwellbacteria bacterium]|nr:hypothetical protein [Candidatus Colwellbacteria bacterium]